MRRSPGRKTKRRKNEKKPLPGRAAAFRLREFGVEAVGLDPVDGGLNAVPGSGLAVADGRHGQAGLLGGRERGLGSLRVQALGNVLDLHLHDQAVRQRQTLQVKAALQREHRNVGAEAVLLAADFLRVGSRSAHADRNHADHVIALLGLVQANDLAGQQPADVDHLAAGRADVRLLRKERNMQRCRHAVRILLTGTGERRINNRVNHREKSPFSLWRNQLCPLFPCFIIVKS